MSHLPLHLQFPIPPFPSTTVRPVTSSTSPIITTTTKNTTNIPQLTHPTTFIILFTILFLVLLAIPIGVCVAMCLERCRRYSRLRDQEVMADEEHTSLMRDLEKGLGVVSDEDEDDDTSSGVGIAGEDDDEKSDIVDVDSRVEVEYDRTYTSTG